MIIYYWWVCEFIHKLQKGVIEISNLNKIKKIINSFKTCCLTYIKQYKCGDKL